MKRVILLLWIVGSVSLAIAQHADHSQHSDKPETATQTEQTDSHAGHQMDHTQQGTSHDQMTHEEGHDMDMAEGEHQHVHKPMTEEQKKEIGVDEKLDQFIPMDLVFTMEDGTQKPLRDIITHPTLIVPIYFNCPNVCHILQSSVASVLPRVKLEPGSQYQVLSVSFDELDTPDVARQKKANYMAAMDHQFPEDAWHFLTGDLETVSTFMDSIGFRYKREGRDFIHPVVVVAVTDQGKISRYIYGSNFLPFDITMALTEASAGRSGLSVKRLVSYCFSYDPEGKKYVFNITKVAGTIILIFAVGIFLVLTLGGRKKKRKSSE